MDDLKKIREQGVEYTVKVVSESDFDYSEDNAWQQLKSDSIKAYKKLKAREFYLRHNT